MRPRISKTRIWPLAWSMLSSPTSSRLSHRILRGSSEECSLPDVPLSTHESIQSVRQCISRPWMFIKIFKRATYIPKQTAAINIHKKTSSIKVTDPYNINFNKLLPTTLIIQLKMYKHPQSSQLINTKSKILLRLFVNMF